MNNKFKSPKPEDNEDTKATSSSGAMQNSTESHSNDQPSKINTSFTVPHGEHRLQFAYSLWYSRSSPGNKTTALSYDQNLKLIGTFLSVEQFWSHYSFLVRPSELTGNCDFHLFKDGIKPMWEDGANKNGGKWVVRLRKGLSSRCWENLILAMLGEQFMVGEEICGAVIAIRFQEDIISVWNKTASDQATSARIRDTLKRVLNLPANTVMEYKKHTDSLRQGIPIGKPFFNKNVFKKDEDPFSRPKPMAQKVVQWYSTDSAGPPRPMKLQTSQSASSVDMK